MPSGAIPALSVGELTIRLVVAAALGGAIGMERELRERGAGLRTHMVVCVGAALFTIVSAYGFRDFIVHGGSLDRADPTRIAAQIVSGIGFLGAGAIIRQGLSVRGLTTAATLWLVAAIGMAAGAGYYTAAAIATGGALVSLWPLRIAAYRLFSRLRPETGRLLVQLPAGAAPGAVMDAVEAAGAHVHALEVSQEGDRRTMALDVAVRDPQLARVVAGVADVEGVLDVRWME